MSVTIYLDIDGVMCDLSREVAHRAVLAGFNVNERMLKNNAEDFMWEDLSPEITSDWVHSLYDDPTFWLNAIPHEEAWFFVNYYGNEHRIVYVTGRREKYLNVYYRWFYDWEMPVDEIVCTDDKGEYLSSVGDAEFFIEDMPHYALDIVKNGVHCYLLNRKYNQEIVPGVERINSMWEVSV